VYHVYYMTIKSTHAQTGGGFENVIVQWLTVYRSLTRTYNQRLINLMASHRPSRKFLPSSFIINYHFATQWLEHF
jgi:hypothetical protein